jgi:hypothetical protein
MGVIVPTKVERVALQNAASSIAAHGLLLTTDLPDLPPSSRSRRRRPVQPTQGGKAPAAYMYLAAFPVEIVPDQGKPAPHGSFWGHGDTCLYGRYLPYADEQGRTPTSLGGMSGGLLIEFSTTNTSHIDIRLAGIMSAELETTAYIKATRASLLAAFCDAIAKAVASDRVGASDIDRSTGIP